jgi:3alpha(or 20beta)-hydroxysteroid dehydrogenase
LPSSPAARPAWGAAHARAFIREGARVTIADIADDAGRALADELGAAATYLHLDVTRAGHWEAAVAETQRIFGKLDVLVNNAGVLDGGPLGTYTERQWGRVLSVNLTGPFLGISAARDALIAARPASVINISSAAGIQGVSGMHAYTASKFGLRGLTKSAALELASHGVRVNSVHPAES